MKPIPQADVSRFLLLSGIVSMITVATGREPRPTVITVCDVPLAERPLQTRPAPEILRRGAGDEVEAFSPVDGLEWIAPIELIGHPFIAAAHRAFADHRPLALSPDMIWQLLVQIAAEEVHAVPEKHRGLFTDHASGGRTLEVRRDDFLLGGTKNDWPGVFAELEGRIVTKTAGSPTECFSHSFSTSSPTEIAARRVVLLKAASPFYNYQVSTLCGIPRIELHGTVDDWRWIRERVADLRQFNMERRCKAVAPILDECVAAAGGKANPVFWKSFYKYASESGSSYVSGWINVFFVGEDDKLLDVVLDPKFTWTAPPEKEESYGAVNLPLAITTRSYKSMGVVDVDFVWQYFERTIPMRWRAGYMGVAQDRQSMTLKPVIAWQVLRAKLSSEERKAADYLSSLEKMSNRAVRAIEHGMALDAETGFIRNVSPARGGPIDSRFWKKALPMMTRLEVLETSPLLRLTMDRAERKAICEAMLSAPTVKVVIVDRQLDPEYLHILEGRKDWRIEVQKRE